MIWMEEVLDEKMSPECLVIHSEEEYADSGELVSASPQGDAGTDPLCDEEDDSVDETTARPE